MKKWLALVVFVIAPVGGLIYWRLGLKREEAKTQSSQREARLKAPPVVNVAVVTTQDIGHSYEGVASIESPLNVKLSPKVTGRLLSVLVREGDVVRAGQPLATIDPAEIDAEVARMRATVAEAKSRLAQAQLNQGPTDASVVSEIRKQEAGVVSAQADFNQAKQNFASQVASADSTIVDTQGRISVAQAAISNGEAAIRSAQANLDNAKSKFNRVTDLYKQGFIAAQDVDDARTLVSVQQSAVEGAQGQLASAKALRDSAAAQRNSAQQQADIVKTKGKTDIESANARLRQAQASLDYAKANRAQKPAFQANIDALRSSVAAAEATLRSSEARRSDTVLTSTVDGSVTGRYMDPGATATAGTPVLSVQSVKQLWASAPIPEETSHQIVMGQPAEVVVDGLPGRKFMGKIVQINPSADLQSRQFLVRVGLDNAKNDLKAGMFAHIKIPLSLDRGAIIIPREALLLGSTVMLVGDDGVAHKTPVVSAPGDAENVIIRSGLQVGQKVIVLSANQVKDNQEVKIAGGKPKP